MAIDKKTSNEIRAKDLETQQDNDVWDPQERALSIEAQQALYTAFKDDQVKVWAQAVKTTGVCKKCNHKIFMHYNESIIADSMIINLNGDKTA